MGEAMTSGLFVLGAYVVAVVAGVLIAKWVNR